MAKTKDFKKNEIFSHITFRITKELHKKFTKKLIDIEKTQTQFLTEKIELFLNDDKKKEV